MEYNKINNLIGWTCAITAMTVYSMTVEPTTSWWDCGEFISAAYKMQIVHQPGAPLFLMIQNLFSNFAMGDKKMIAQWMNIGSAVCSGFTILFLFWIITALVKKVYLKLNTPISSFVLTKIMGAGIIGAMSYAFTDTFWYSAVESEVYSMSSLCTAIVFWMILKWDARADEPGSSRWIILIAYLMGLSIGVHLLNLLVIPAIALVIYNRKASNVTFAGSVKVIFLGIVSLACVLWGIIQFPIKLAAYFDLFFVNYLNFGFGTGVAVFLVLLVAVLVIGILYSIRKGKATLNLVLLCISFLLFGYSSYTMIVIRTQAAPSLNNSAPDNVFSFLSYLNRDQYGSEPLLKGRYFNSKAISESSSGNMYRKDKEKYAVTRVKKDYIYDKETIFPRIYSQQHENIYRAYLNLSDSDQPTLFHNLKFLFSYQVNYMYWRYFMWNFVGRQNDSNGHMLNTEGNWISGIRAFDNYRIGGQYVLPAASKANPSRNTYFFLPLILGIVGLVWHFKNSRKDTIIVMLLFFFTGLAIVLYLNQTPIQPRERDYAYAGSFFFFSIWIGFGTLGITELLTRKFNENFSVAIALSLCCVAGPILLATQNWDDHDRSNNYLARDFAKNILESCEPNAILFNYGDNDTYPLWYLQEVEGIRTDVRLVNLSLLSSDWYMKQMMKPVNDAGALPLNIDPEKIKDGIRDVIPYYDLKINEHVDIQKLLAVMLSDVAVNQRRVDDEMTNILPTKMMFLRVDKKAAMAGGVPDAFRNHLVDTMKWSYPLDYVSRRELTLMAILASNNWERPIYFTNNIPKENYMGLDKYLVSEGFVSRILPVRFPQVKEDSLITAMNTAGIYKRIVEKYKWGNVKHASFLDPTSSFYVRSFSMLYGDIVDRLVKTGKLDEARIVVKIAFDNLPKRDFSMDDVTSKLLLVQAMYRLGEKKMADACAASALNFIDENMKYYVDLNQRGMNFDRREVHNGFIAIQHYQKMLEMDHGNLLSIEFDKLLDRYSTLFS